MINFYCYYQLKKKHCNKLAYRKKIKQLLLTFNIPISGTNKGFDDVLSFTSAGLSESVTIVDLDLNPGQAYYATVTGNSRANTLFLFASEKYLAHSRLELDSCLSKNQEVYSCMSKTHGIYFNVSFGNNYRLHK